jgi:hypothetical protein
MKEAELKTVPLRITESYSSSSPSSSSFLGRDWDVSLGHRV